MKLKKTMIFTSFLILFFIGFVLLYFWASSTGNTSSQYYTPFLKMTNQVGCVPGYNQSIPDSNCSSIASGQAFTGQSMYGAIAATIASAAIVGGVVGLIFPNPWAIFAGVAMTMVTFLTLPLNLLDDATMPMPIRFSIVGLYVLATMGLISWFKGGGTA